MKKIKLLVAALIMVCFALQVPASGGSGSCGGIAAAVPGCENITSNISDHLENDRIRHDDYFHPDYGVDYGYLTKGAEDDVCYSFVNYCIFWAPYTLHRFLTDPDTYYIGSCEE